MTRTQCASLVRFQSNRPFAEQTLLNLSDCVEFVGEEIFNRSFPPVCGVEVVAVSPLIDLICVLSWDPSAGLRFERSPAPVEVLADAAPLSRTVATWDAAALVCGADLLGRIAQHRERICRLERIFFQSFCAAGRSKLDT